MICLKVVFSLLSFLVKQTEIYSFKHSYSSNAIALFWSFNLSTICIPHLTTVFPSSQLGKVVSFLFSYKNIFLTCFENGARSAQLKCKTRIYLVSQWISLQILIIWGKKLGEIAVVPPTISFTSSHKLIPDLLTAFWIDSCFLHLQNRMIGEHILGNFCV